MKKLLLILLLLLPGCTEKKYYPKEYISLNQRIYEGYISTGDPIPKIIPLDEGWQSVAVYVYGNDDKMLPLPVTLSGVTQYYQIDLVNNNLEIYVQGWLYRAYVTY